MGGRVKTLHPKIHGGILGKRDTHQLEADQHDIGWIDLVVVKHMVLKPLKVVNHTMK